MQETTAPIWEDFISINSQARLSSRLLGPPADYAAQANGEVQWDEELFPLEQMLERDKSALPVPEHREGYYGENHFNYWASGLRDYSQLIEWTRSNGVEASALLDIGCASGRFLRHVRNHGEIKTVYGCDINRLHVDWVNRYLPRDIVAFQSTAMPTLPLPDECVDVVTAFSVFTHVESFDTTWLMEMRRILRPGGIAWLTIHGDRTWREMQPTWPIYAGLDSHPEFATHRENPELTQDRLVFRWFADKSYSANVFYRCDYIKSMWGRLMEVKDIFPARPAFQDIVVLQKR